MAAERTTTATMAAERTTTATMAAERTTTATMAAERTNRDVEVERGESNARPQTRTRSGSVLSGWPREVVTRGRFWRLCLSAPVSPWGPYV